MCALAAAGTVVTIDGGTVTKDIDIDEMGDAEVRGLRMSEKTTHCTAWRVTRDCACSKRRVALDAWPHG